MEAQVTAVDRVKHFWHFSALLMCHHYFAAIALMVWWSWYRQSLLLLLQCLWDPLTVAHYLPLVLLVCSVVSTSRNCRPHEKVDLVYAVAAYLDGSQTTDECCGKGLEQMRMGALHSFLRLILNPSNLLHFCQCEQKSQQCIYIQI